jgi:hypothetical protein
LLQAHGYIMNGGVLHAVELLSLSELGNAAAGYAYFGLVAVVSLLARATAMLKAESDPGEQERQLDTEYLGIIPSDSALMERFEQRLKLAPNDFAPLRPEDLAWVKQRGDGWHRLRVPLAMPVQCSHPARSNSSFPRSVNPRPSLFTLYASPPCLSASVRTNSPDHPLRAPSVLRGKKAFKLHKNGATTPQ